MLKIEKKLYRAIHVYIVHVHVNTGLPRVCICTYISLGRHRAATHTQC